MAAFAPAGKHKILRTCRFPILAKNQQQALGQNHIPLVVALAFVDTNHHAAAIDVADAQRDGFAHTQARSILNHQDGAVLQAAQRQEETNHFLLAQHHRKLSPSSGRGDALKKPVPA